MNLQGKEGTNAATSTLPRKCCFLVCMITRMSEMRAAPHVPSFSHFGVGFVEGYRPLGLANFRRLSRFARPLRPLLSILPGT